MERFSLYREVHKGIRVLLLNVLERTGQTDFTDPAAVMRLRTEVQATFELLESHALKEDTYYLPLLTRFAPKVAWQLSRSHEEQAGTIEGLRALLEEAHGPRASHHGHAFYLHLSQFVSEQLQHMAQEELEAMPALWQHLPDEELGRVSAELVSHIPPAEMNQFMAIILPALNPTERWELVNGIRQSAPPAALEGVLGLAQSVLPPSDYEALHQHLAS